MVNATYRLDLSGEIHFAFTVTFQAFSQIRSGFRRRVIDHLGLVLRPAMLCPTMRTKYLADKIRKHSKGGIVHLNAGVDQLFANGTDGENLRHEPLRPPRTFFG